MADKRLRILEGLGLQGVWPYWAPLGVVVEGEGRAPSGLPSGAFPHPIVTPRLGETPRCSGGGRQGPWAGVLCGSQTPSPCHAWLISLGLVLGR